jgi:arabinose-5-phosphate isomerase
MSLESARRVLRIEAEAVGALAGRLDQSFVRVLDILQACRGRVVLTGMGKSGFIARKIAATLASTGSPALFLHPAEGVHGDLGMLVRGDVVVAVSNSGETEEITQLLPAFKRLGVSLISLVGNPQSTLARQSDVVLDVGVAEEACPMNLAPTASTTAALAMGDALAVALLERRGIQAGDFALVHPGGTLGRKLLLTVEDLMHRGDEVRA